MTESITTRAQLKAMTAEQIEAARIGGLVDFAALGAERTAEDERARRRVANIRRRIADGVDPRAAEQIQIDLDNLPPDAA